MRRICWMAVAGAVVALPPRAVRADLVYDNLATPPGPFVATALALVSGTPVFDDLQIDGGGPLEAVVAAVKANGFGEVIIDPTLYLYLDDGNGTPELGTGDVLLGTSTLAGESIPTGGFPAPIHEINFDVSSLNIYLPNNATVWAGVALPETELSITQSVYFDVPVIGSTDEFVYRQDGLGGMEALLVPSAQPEPLTGAWGLGFQLTVGQVPEPGSAVLLVVGTLCIRRRCRRRRS